MNEEKLSMQELLRLGEKVEKWSFDIGGDGDVVGSEFYLSGYIEKIEITVSCYARSGRHGKNDDYYEIKALGLYGKIDYKDALELGKYGKRGQGEICKFYRSTAKKFREQEKKREIAKWEIDPEAARNELIKRARNLLD